MRKHLYAASAILAASLVFIVSGAGPLPAKAQTDPASRAIQYLQSQQLPDGSVPGFSAFDGTEYFVIAAGAAGYDPNQLRNGSGQSSVAFLQAGGTAASGDAGNTGRLIQAVVAAGANPHAFGAAGDLIAKLTGPGYYAPATGAFGNGQTATQALAIEGLVAAGTAPPAVSIDYLMKLQDSDGGFNYTSAANDPSGSDTNSTAAAIMALDSAGSHLADSAAITWLTATSQQQTDGGFGYQGGPSDPISTASVLQMLVAADQNPNGVAWTVTGKTPYSNLLAVQGASGGFLGYLGTPDAATTSQVAFGLLQQPLPARGVYVNGAGVSASVASGLGALRFLQSQQSGTTGGLPPGLSVFDASEFYVIGAAAAGYDGNQLFTCSGASVIQYLRANVSAATADAGNTGRLIMAVAAAGLSPTSFGGIMPLTSTLQGFYHPTGIYGDGQTATQSLAIQAVVAAGQAPAPAAVAYLKALHDGDGGWNYTAAANDPAGSDTNSTAVALMALAAAGDHSADAAALGWLRTQQQADGGFGYQGAPSDPISDALVTQALLAAFQDPSSTSRANGWAVGSSSPLTYLAAQEEGGGGFVGYTGAADVATTSQVVSGLERRPFPVRPSASPTILAPTSCPIPPPTPTAAPAVTPVVTAVQPPEAVASLSPSPSPSPSPIPSPSAALPSPVEVSPQEGPIVGSGAGASGNGGAGGIPPTLLYALVAGAALGAVVLVGGVVLYLRR